MDDEETERQIETHPTLDAAYLVASLPAGAAVPFAPEFLDSDVEAEELTAPQYIPTIKQRHVDSDTQCPTGKVPFLTSSGARSMLKTFKARRDEWREKSHHLIIYRCRKCRRYHIGNAVNFDDGGWNKQQRKRRPRNLPDRHLKQRKKDHGRSKSKVQSHREKRNR